jgi:hypothetical protein
MGGVVGLIGGVLGAMIGAWCAVAFPRKASRRQLALQLFERYTSSVHTGSRGNFAGATCLGAG